jgi:hypothetical protein
MSPHTFGGVIAHPTRSKQLHSTSSIKEEVECEVNSTTSLLDVGCNLTRVKQELKKEGLV